MARGITYTSTLFKTMLIGILLSPLSLLGATIKGKIADANKEAMTGAYIIVEGHSEFGIAGLDGSYAITDLKPGNYSLTVSFVGYNKILKEFTIAEVEQVVLLNITLHPEESQLQEIVVTAHAEKGSEMEARSMERNLPNTVNIISAKAISLSPDISVANVIQRVSGLSVERNSNGDPQYAIVRGMDKRYSYTLVNGLKIPSPDNKNRYLPLDIFPSSLLERLEVYKSLTADMEGDAIGGAINMVMKSAPDEFQIKGDLQIGYNTINSLYGFDRYKSGIVASQSPREEYGSAYQAQPADFTKENLEVNNISPLPDLLGSFSIGNRYLKDRLGILVGGSLQNSYRGTKSLWFDYDTDRFGANLPSLRSVQDRYYSTQQLRAAFHTRLDFRFNPDHELKAYAAYFRLNTYEARQIKETFLDGRNYDPNAGSAILAYSTRTKSTQQGIITTSIEGKHKIFTPLVLSWSAVASQAGNDQPDNARFVRNGELRDFEEQPQNVERRNSRQWSQNTDNDVTGYLNFSYQPSAWSNSLIKAGAMMRAKNRDNYFNRYFFDPNPGLQIQGQDWNTYSDVKWEIVNPAGSATDELNYEADEKITAWYVLGKIQFNKTELNAGLRLEETHQGYSLKSPTTGQTPDSTQTYTDALPSISIKHEIAANTNLRFTYYKSISRPGFFEIVPYRIEDDGYKDYGNPQLKRVKAHSLDLRLEKFPDPSNQFLLGVFYKHIQDPIEYAVVRSGVNNEPVMQPNNFGTAHNMGFEADITKFFSKFGIKANYTFTYSRITTSKSLRTRVDENDPSSELTVKFIDQTRPLQGQAAHIGNVSLLYKDMKKGWESQLSLVYTGERLEAISPFLNNDMYAKPITILDYSLEKRISKTVDLFVKATNLLNSSYQIYIKKPLYQEEGKEVNYPFQNDPHHKTMVRKDQYYQSFRIGVRFVFNKPVKY